VKFDSFAANTSELEIQHILIFAKKNTFIPTFLMNELKNKKVWNENTLKM
jgi:hypothetical protein